MSEMIERVAAKLDEVMYKPERKTDWAQAPAQHHDVCRQLARVAISAMRDPTVAMATNPLAISYSRPPHGNQEVLGIWRAMIDSALKP